MKRSRKALLLGLIFIGAMLALVLNGWRPALWMPALRNESTYQGKSASEWTELLKDKNFGVRWKAIAALNYIAPDGESPVPVLVSLLHDENEQVRAQAVQALGGLGEEGSQAVPQIVAMFHDPSDLVREQAVYALCWVGSGVQGAIPDLIRCLADESPAVRRNAAMCLGTIGADAKEAVPALLARVQDAKELALVKQRAAVAIQQIDLGKATELRLERVAPLHFRRPR